MVAPGYSQQRSPVLTPRQVRTAEFTRTSRGRRGYSEEEVRRFLERVADALAASDGEKANLRAEVYRVKNALRAWQSEHRDRLNGAARPAPSVDAVNLLSQAQQAADAQVAQAEDYSRRLVMQAREHYERILRQAEQQAAEAAEQAAQAYRKQRTDGTGDQEREELERRLAYLQTFAEVTQVQLRSVLQGLGQEVEKLTSAFRPPSGTGGRPE